jgi:hypothetical protein
MRNHISGWHDTGKVINVNCRCVYVEAADSKAPKDHLLETGGCWNLG